MSTWRIFLIALGLAVILWSFRPKARFYPRAMGIGSKDRTLPKWFGRLWFGLFGSFFIALGLSSSERLDRILSACFALAIGVISFGVGVWPGWMPDRSNENRGRAWLGRIIALVLGVVFFCVGLSELRH